MNALEKGLVIRATQRQAEIRRTLSDVGLSPTQYADLMKRLEPLFSDAARCLRICTDGPTEEDAKWLVWKNGK